MFLRPYRPADKRNLQQLYYDTIHTVNAGHYSPEQLALWAPEEPNRDTWAKLDNQYCFIVEYQKNIVGFASLSQEGRVDFLYVHKHFQGRGIATTLLKQLERLAHKKGFAHLAAEVNINARGFFERVGFRLLDENRKLQNGVEFCNFEMDKALPLSASNNT